MDFAFNTSLMSYGKNPITLHANGVYWYCCYKYYSFQCIIQLLKREIKK